MFTLSSVIDFFGGIRAGKRQVWCLMTFSKLPSGGIFLMARRKTREEGVIRKFVDVFSAENDLERSMCYVLVFILTWLL